MANIKLRKINNDDVIYFTKWWRDGFLIGITSGNFDPISDSEISEAVNSMIHSKYDYHFMIKADDQTAGHLSLIKANDGWYETQIVIGESEHRGKSIGTLAIQQLIKFAKTEGIRKVFLEVRPDNLAAIKCYEKSGVVKTQLVDHKDNPNLLQTLRMEVCLDILADE